MDFTFPVPATAGVPSDWVYHTPVTEPSLQQDLADVRIVFTELDTGIEVEWRAELASNCFTSAQRNTHIIHGYIDAETFYKGKPRLVAEHLAKMTISKTFGRADVALRH